MTTGRPWSFHIVSFTGMSFFRFRRIPEESLCTLRCPDFAQMIAIGPRP